MTAGDVEVIKGTINSHLAVSFDGTTDDFRADAHPVARASANDTVGTYSLWFMPDNITGTYGLIGCGDAAGGANEEFLIEQAANDIRIYGRTQGAAGFDIITTNAALEKNVWVHIAVVQNGTRPTIYINGLAVAMTDTVSTNLDDWYDEWANLDECTIGSQTNDGAESNGLLGVLGPIKYWSIDLLASEVLREFEGEDASPDTGRQVTIAAALEEYWAWDGLLTSSGGDATTAVATNQAYLSGWTSQWSRAIENRGYTHANDKYNTFRDGTEYVTIVIQGA